MKYVPDRDEFVRLAQDATVIPVYREMIADADTPVSALAKLGPGSSTFLLESVTGGETVGRYSFLGNSALLTFRSRGSEVVITSADGQKTRETVADPLARLEQLLAQFRPASVPGLPRFFGGAVGYVGYEGIAPDGVALPANKTADAAADDGATVVEDVPDLYFLITDAVLIFDHSRRNVQVVVNAVPGDDPGAAYDEACRRIDDIVMRLESESGLRPLPGVGNGALLATSASADSRGAAVLREGNAAFRGFASTYGGGAGGGTFAEFGDAVDVVRRRIADGDVFQVVLSRRFVVPLRARPFDVYRVLRSINPSPYMFFLDFGDVQLVGSSPEVMVRLEDGVASLRPIAGTRRRGQTPREDEQLAAELLADEKELAEHVMLVDLGRDDLSRVCEYGTVQLERVMAVEKYSHVMHIVSDVTGRLAAGRTAFDLLRAVFPAGTVSGAPKRRAMALIRELEPVRRGPYAGAIGYFGFSGNMDSCIAIRTIVCQGGLARVQAGAGIVADSDAEREAAEIASKCAALLQTLAVANEVSA